MRKNRRFVSPVFYFGKENSYPNMKKPSLLPKYPFYNNFRIISWTFPFEQDKAFGKTVPLWIGKASPVQAPIEVRQYQTNIQFS